MPSIRSILFNRKDHLSFAILILVMLGGSLLELTSLGAFPLFVSLITASEANPNMRKQLSSILSQLNLPQSDNFILWGGILLACLFAIRTLYLLVSYACQERVLQNRRIALSTRLFKAYMHAPYAYYLQHTTSACLGNITNESERIILGCLDTSLNIIRNIIILVTVTVLMLIYDPWVCLGVFFSLSLTAGSFMFFTKRKLQQLGETIYHDRQAVIKQATEGMDAIREIQILNVHQTFQQRFHTTIQHQCNQAKSHGLLTRSIWPIMETITCAVILSTMAIMALSGLPQQEIAPTITLVAVCLARLKGTISEIMIFTSQFRFHFPIAQQVAKDLWELEKFPQTVEPDPQLTFKRDVTLKHVSFAFPQAEHDTLYDLHVTIPAGQTLGIVGPTGSGKSTLANVIAALLPPTQGNLEVDGTTISTPQQIRAWQNLLGIVSQDPCLTNDTIAANIALGVPAADIDQKRLNHAIEIAQLTQFIDQLPEHLQTIVGDRGIRLSGGQKQRIAIARALYRPPSLILFDEATSALDVTTEKAVVKALENLHGKHTIIVIAHRLSTVRQCDSIIFLKDGHILGQGTYDQLKDSLPEFASMTNA